MATTTTISSSTTGSVVGRSTMSLVGAVSPPTTPPATPTSPIMSASDSNKVEDEEVPAIPIDPASSSVKDQKVMATTPPPSPPPASVSAALMPGTPSLTDLDLDALPLKATITTAVLDNGAGHSLSTAIKSERLGSGSGSDVIPSLPSETTTIVASPSPSPSLSSSLPLPSSPSSSLSTAVESAVDVAITVTPPIPTGEATTFFDDMINAPQPPANILTLGPTTSLPDLYHDFFDNHPELYDSGQLSDPEMDLDPEDFASLTTSAMIRARTHTMTDLSQTSGTTIQVPLIADRPKLETIDTINLMIHHQNGAHGQSHVGLHGQANSDVSTTSQGYRRKKASRACFHCQKAHLTCDDSRPCQRCIKRDLAGSCTDGVRKKAKYLQDAVDSQQQAAETESQTGSVEGSPLNDAHALFSFPDVPSPLSSSSSRLSSLTSTAAAQSTIPLTSTANSNLLTSSTTSTILDHGFGSDAINLEYSILSTMLSSPTAELQSIASGFSMVDTWQRQDALEAMANTLQQQQQHQGHLQRSVLAQQQQQQQQLQQPLLLKNNTGKSIFGQSDTLQAANGSMKGTKRKFPSNTPENVYANTKQPFNYTDGFHYLLQYVRERMDKEEMMRVCRAMAMFRPSFIALIMNLTPEDLIFMETCFQRTILEFEKLISYSGTPTVVWRRTGEIALVGKEFSLLTQWSRDQLVPNRTNNNNKNNKNKFIYELMDNQSAVEYWEKFSTRAFENTEQTVMTTCILLSPTNRVVPCTFCFTIKRDIFDIPLAIVGNFLPILS